MYIHCNVRSCKHWKEGASDFLCDVGGCTLDEVTISEDKVTAAGCLPLCEEYEERKE